MEPANAEHASTDKSPPRVPILAVRPSSTSNPPLSLPRHHVRRASRGRSPQSISLRHPRSPRHGRKLSRKGDFFSDLASVAFHDDPVVASSSSTKKTTAPSSTSMPTHEVASIREQGSGDGDDARVPTSKGKMMTRTIEEDLKSECKPCSDHGVLMEDNLLVLELLGSCGIQSCPVSPRQHQRSMTYGGASEFRSSSPQPPKGPRIRQKARTRKFELS
mmetsp:Transcript_21435/g.43007  ORF Transcript_21435/g.43007 Transcript_21435/m.43007 type:complete len:218 (-) Transcript_21435:35-688(-)